MKTRKLIKEYLAHVKHKRKWRTHRMYKQRLVHFAKRFGSRDFGKIDSLEIEKHIRKLSRTICPHTGKPYSGTTMHHEISMIQALQAFAIKQRIIRNPIIIGKLEKPPVAKRQFIPTQEQIDALLATAKGRPDFVTLFRALLACGARPGELCAALIERDVDWTKREIVLADHKTVGKTGKPRRIPIGPALEALIRESIGDRTEGPVFLTIRGHAWTAEHASAVQRDLRTRASLPEEFVLYCTRHLFVTRLLKAGVPAPKVALLVGHANSTITESVYSHLEIDDEIRNLQTLAG